MFVYTQGRGHGRQHKAAARTSSGCRGCSEMRRCCKLPIGRSPAQHQRAPSHESLCGKGTPQRLLIFPSRLRGGAGIIVCDWVRTAPPTPTRSGEQSVGVPQQSSDTVALYHTDLRFSGRPVGGVHCSHLAQSWGPAKHDESYAAKQQRAMEAANIYTI